jgi:cytoskeletal protein CcmA (bactofilin family)
MRRILVGLVALCTLLPAGPALAADDTPDSKIVVSGSVLVDRGETVPGDVVVVDGDILIRGTVKGNVVALAGDVTIRGKVGGDVVTIAGVATLGRAARVSGDLKYADKKPVVAKGAKVSGKVKKYDGGSFSGTLATAAIVLWIAFAVSMLLLGILLLLIAPRAADAIARTAKNHKGMAIIVGILAAVLLPILAGLLSITVIGTPLGIILFLLLLPLFALAFVSTGFAIGRLIIKGGRILALIVGLLILCLLTLVPFVGALVGLLAVIFGLGLLFATLFRVRSA